MASLADIRARLQAQEDKKSKNFNSEGNQVYAHWNADEGTTSIIRFLEDADPDNPYFWKERLMFRLPFNGIKNDPTNNKTVIVQVPCMEMYDGERCPVLDEVRQWFKDPSLEEMGRKYWKKRSYIFQGFVRQSPITEDNVPENPIRRFVISPQIFTKVKDSLLDPEIEHLPTDKEHGLDFRILKGSKGGYADYNGSTWARKETALTDEELAAIEKHGLFTLSDFLPPKPTAEQQKVIMEMFEASVEGEAYDPERWGAYYTPPGMQRSGNQDANTSESSSKPAPKAAEKQAEDVAATNDTVAEAAEAATAAAKVEEEAAPAKGGTQDILQMIRDRQK